MPTLSPTYRNAAPVGKTGCLGGVGGGGTIGVPLPPHAANKLSKRNAPDNEMRGFIQCSLPMESKYSPKIASGKFPGSGYPLFVNQKTERHQVLSKRCARAAPVTGRQEQFSNSGELVCLRVNNGRGGIGLDRPLIALPSGRAGACYLHVGCPRPSGRGHCQV